MDEITPDRHGAHPMLIYWKAFAWTGLALLFGLAVWLLSPMLLPFVMALIIAYFLDPIVSRLTRWGLSRVASALLVAVLSFGTLLAAVAVLVPVVVSQGSALLDSLPQSLDEAESELAEILPETVREYLDSAEPILHRILAAVQEAGQGLAGSLAQGVSGLISVVLFWVVMPVVTVYLLIDWQRLIKAADDLLPRPSAPKLREIAADIDGTLSAYIRGQALVCVILMGYYSFALSLVGLPFAIVVGAVTGAVSFIPYIGMFIGTSLGVGIALWQFWGDPGWIVAVIGIYALGLFVESEILVPRMVGAAVNLHPVWMIFAVIAFGTLFGFVGALIAVPLAAVAGVIARHLTEHYRKSTLYRGSGAPP
ncbi:MAG: AI-2E family transporter [Roseinatronobacter sp.]